jgi:hypothetical protein
MSLIVPGTPLLQQLKVNGLLFDQLMYRALEVSASHVDLTPEDEGFPDSYLTVALYRLNTILTRTVTLNEKRWNVFHDYRNASRCSPDEVVPGRRLCRVLNKAVDLAKPGKVIGIGHYLRAVVSLSLDEKPEPAYGFPGQVIHNTFSAESFLWGLGYSAWTPLTQAKEVSDLLKALAGREDVENIQYLMTFEGSRIVFRPTRILDPVCIGDERGKTTKGLSVLTHFKDLYAGVTPDEILALEELLNNPMVKEADLQRFFDEHRQFFSMWNFTDIYPHVYLTREDQGPLIPDFILVSRELQRATIIDLKLPKVTTIVHKPNRDRFSAAVEESRSQLLEYRDWFEDSSNRQRLKDKLGMEVYRPRLGVIIGTAQEFRSLLERQKLTSRYSDIEIVTYDDVLANAQRRLMLVREANTRVL